MLNEQDLSAGPEAQLLELGAILILEDEPLLSIALEELAKDMGARQVFVHHDAEQARRIAENAALDCAILNVHLGRGTSFAIADVLEARGVPFVFSSASSSVAIAERHRGRPLLSKPFTDDELRARVTSLLRRR